MKINKNLIKKTENMSTDPEESFKIREIGKLLSYNKMDNFTHSYTTKIDRKQSVL